MTASEPKRILIHRGSLFKAHVYRVEDGAAAWIEKDFSDSPRIVRNTLGRFQIWQECRILRRLEALGGVPAGAKRLSPFLFREDFCPGFVLCDSACGAYVGNPFDPSKAGGVPAEMLLAPLPRSFFEALESFMRSVHEARVVHLDMHYPRNVLVGPGWKPVVLDWQSALPTGWMPGFLRRALERIDLAGVYKHWDKFRPGELSEHQKRFLRRSRFVRRHFWVPRLKMGTTKK